MKWICVVGVFLVLCFAFNNVHGAEENKESTIVVVVNGLVCDFCARTIEKTLQKQPEVARTNIDLSSKKITLTMNPGRDISDEELIDLVQNAGYGVDHIERGNNE